MYDLDIIHPNVYIFKNMIENPGSMIDHYNSSFYSWNPWYEFGSQLDISHLTIDFENFPTLTEWKKQTEIVGKYETADYLNNFIKKSIQNENKINLTKDTLKFVKDSQENVKHILDLFYETTNFYMTATNVVEKQNLRFNTIDIAKYHPDAGITEDLAMSYHTDFIQHESNSLDYNFFITCLFYLNDSYLDGEISFKFLDEKQRKIAFKKNYKPTAGDIIVFPSTPPFYHGVKKTREGEKYIIRAWWKNSRQDQNFNLKNEDSESSFYVGNDKFSGFRDIV